MDDERTAVRARHARGLSRGVILALFFGSGACALIYETVWVRQLTLSFGISIHAVSAVLAAYMFGLSIGAWIVGRWAARIQNPLRVYAIFEIAISAYAVVAYGGRVLRRGRDLATVLKVFDRKRLKSVG